MTSPERQEIVEAAAKAMYAERVRFFALPGPNWEALRQDKKDAWLRYANSALDAILPLVLRPSEEVYDHPNPQYIAAAKREYKTRLKELTDG